MSADDADTEHRHAGSPHSSPVPLVGMILPGTVQVISIAPQHTPEGQRRWRITLRAVVRVPDDPDLGDMECELSFTTADSRLVRQIRRKNLRYVLDWIQLQREGAEEGLLLDEGEDVDVDVDVDVAVTLTEEGAGEDS